MMGTYNFETVIREDGIIVLPDSMKNLKKRRVKFVLVDLEESYSGTADILSDITEQYNRIKEKDLDITEIYKNRRKTDVRERLYQCFSVLEALPAGGFI